MTLMSGGMPDHALSWAVERRLGMILESWEGTPYCAGQQVRGVGVDCVRFGTAVLDELYRRTSVTPCPRLPQDISMHDKVGALGGLKFFLRQYPNHVRVNASEVEPGDCIVTGPQGGGPGHLMIVGPRENTLWQASGHGVHYTGLAMPPSVQTVYSCYRLLDKHLWR